MMSKKEEIRVWLSSDILMKLRVMKVKGGSYSYIIEKALREFFDKNRKEIESVVRKINLDIFILHNGWDAIRIRK